MQGKTNESLDALEWVENMHEITHHKILKGDV